MKTCLGTCRSPFSFEKSNAGRKFSIEDRVNVERSQKSLKVDRKTSNKNVKIRGAYKMSTCSFVCFGFVCFFCFVCTGPSIDPGVQNTLNVHAPRDGTATGRHGEAAREHFFKKTIPGYTS